MIKKILPTMIGAALAGGMTVAVADITVFGHLDTSTDFADQDGGADTTNLNCNTCSLGFKGSEDLGNGLKAIFKLDFQFDMTERNGKTKVSKSSHSAVTKVTTDSEFVEGVGGGSPVLAVTDVGTKSNSFSAVTNVKDTDSITDRDQWLGLAGNFGQIRFGTISTVYKSHGASIDPVYRTSVQGRGIGLQSGLHTGAGEQGQGRAEDTFRYDSPSWNGLKVGAHYTMQTETQADSSSDSPFGVGAQYKNGPFLVFADYITNDQGGDDAAYKVGGKWTFGNYALFGQYEFDDGLISFRDGSQGLNSSGDRRNKGDGADVWFVGGTGKFGNNMLYAAYGQGDKTTGNDFEFDNGYESFEIVGVHSLSKRTSAYFGYANIAPDANSDRDSDIVTLGMKHKF
jgi:predicted porin